jgi:hypothetical protein
VAKRKLTGPPEKKEQELALAMLFVAALNAQQNSDWKLVQLNEDIFDFQLETGDEKRYLELQEIVIPGKKRGPPYAPDEQVIHSPKSRSKKLGFRSKELGWSTVGA